jgi:hypothetical protein
MYFLKCRVTIGLADEVMTRWTTLVPWLPLFDSAQCNAMRNNEGIRKELQTTSYAVMPNQQLKLTVSANCVKHCVYRFRVSLKAFIMNSFSSGQLGSGVRRSLVAIR